MPLGWVVKKSDGTQVGSFCTPTIDMFALGLGFDEFPMLAGLAPYGRTIFNRHQSKFVRLELERLSLRHVEHEDELAALINLCRSVEQKWHWYLFVLGD